MSVESTVFGGIRLSGEEAEKFMKQVLHGMPKKAARDLLVKGTPLAKEVSRQGFAVVDMTNEKVGD